MDYTMMKLNSQFGSLTKNFTISDWRECRDAEYWKSDNMVNPYDRLSHKIRCVENYLMIKNNRNENRN